MCRRKKRETVVLRRVHALTFDRQQVHCSVLFFVPWIEKYATGIEKCEHGCTFSGLVTARFARVVELKEAFTSGPLEKR